MTKIAGAWIREVEGSNPVFLQGSRRPGSWLRMRRGGRGPRACARVGAHLSWRVKRSAWSSPHFLLLYSGSSVAPWVQSPPGAPLRLLCVGLDAAAESETLNDVFLQSLCAPLSLLSAAAASPRVHDRLWLGWKRWAVVGVSLRLLQTTFSSHSVFWRKRRDFFGGKRWDGVRMKRWADSRLPPRGHNENLQTPDDHRRQQLFFFWVWGGGGGGGLCPRKETKVVKQNDITKGVMLYYPCCSYSDPNTNKDEYIKTLLGLTKQCQKLAHK